MKIKLFFPIIIFQIFLASCGGDRKEFKGRVPIGENPKNTWIKFGQNWDIQSTILVITDAGDFLTAYFSTTNIMPVKWLVQYRNSYPNAVNNKVVVHGYYNDDGIPWINDAEIEK